MLIFYMSSIGVFIVVCLIYKYVYYLKRRRLIAAIFCRHCKCNRLACSLKRVQPDLCDHALSKHYTPFIPNWLIDEISLKRQFQAHYIEQGISCIIDNFIICPSPHMGYIDSKKQLKQLISSGDGVSFVAYWIAPEIRSYSPLFASIKSNTTNDNQRIDKISATFKPLRGYNNLYKYLKQMNVKLGWSNIEKSREYLSTIADLTQNNIYELTQILNKGKQFVSRLTGVKDIYSTVHFPTSDIYGTIHFHFMTKLHWFELYRIYILGQSTYLENIINRLKQNGNIDAIKNNCRICSQHPYFHSIRGD